MFSKLTGLCKGSMKKAIALLMALILVLGVVPAGIAANVDEPYDIAYEQGYTPAYDTPEADTPEEDYDYEYTPVGDDAYIVPDEDEGSYETDDTYDYDYEQEYEETQIDPDLPQGGYVGIMPLWYWNWDIMVDDSLTLNRAHVGSDTWVTNPTTIAARRNDYFELPLWRYRYQSAFFPMDIYDENYNEWLEINSESDFTYREFLATNLMQLPEGSVYVIIFQGEARDSLGMWSPIPQTTRIQVLIQYTSSFVSFNGASDGHNHYIEDGNSSSLERTDSNYWTGSNPTRGPVLNPETMTVGRPSHDTHGDIDTSNSYLMIRDASGNPVYSRPLGASGVENINVADLKAYLLANHDFTFTPGMIYTIEVTVEEISELNHPNAPEGVELLFPAPRDPIVSQSVGTFTFSAPPTIQKTADREYVFPGQEIEYTILVHNLNTTYVWEDLVVVDQIRIDLVEFLEDTLYIDGSPAPVGSFSFDAYTGELRIYLDPVDPDQEVEITFSVRVRVADTPPQPDARRTAFTPAAANRQSVSTQAMSGGYVGIMPRQFLDWYIRINGSLTEYRTHNGQLTWVTNTTDIAFHRHDAYLYYNTRIRYEFGLFPIHGTNYNPWVERTPEDPFREFLTYDLAELPEGIHQLYMQGDIYLPDWGWQMTPQTTIMLINIQHTSSFVSFNGVTDGHAHYIEDGNSNSLARTDSNYWTGSNPTRGPVLNPETITVGRPSHDTHGDIDTSNSYLIIRDAGGNPVYNRPLGTSGVENINVADLQAYLLANHDFTFTPGMIYTIEVTVEEIPELSHPTLAGQFPAPRDLIVSQSIGTFMFPDDNGGQPGTIPNTVILYHDGEELDRDIEIVELLVQPRINKGVNVPFGQTVEIGQYVTYTLTVTNPNEVNLYDYLVVDNLAGGALIGVRNIVVSPNVGYTTQETTGELRVLLNYLPAEGSVTITFQARVAVGTPAGPVLNIVHLYSYDTETSDREFVGDCDAVITLLVPQPVNIPVTKVWNDNNNAAGFRPSDITVQLRVGSTVIDTVTLNNGNSWTHTFANLPRYRAPGVTINYEIYEPNVPTGYASVVTPNANGSVTITNTFTMPTRAYQH